MTSEGGSGGGATASGMPLNTIEYHSVSFSTIEQFNGISVELIGTLNGNLKYYSIPLKATNNPKIPFKYHSNILGHNTP